MASGAPGPLRTATSSGRQRACILMDHRLLRGRLDRTGSPQSDLPDCPLRGRPRMDKIARQHRSRSSQTRTTVDGDGQPILQRSVHESAEGLDLLQRWRSHVLDRQMEVFHPSQLCRIYGLLGQGDKSRNSLSSKAVDTIVRGVGVDIVTTSRQLSM